MLYLLHIVLMQSLIDAMAARYIDSGTFAALLSLWLLKIAVLYYTEITTKYRIAIQIVLYIRKSLSLKRLEYAWPSKPAN